MSLPPSRRDLCGILSIMQIFPIGLSMKWRSSQTRNLDNSPERYSVEDTTSNFALEPYSILLKKYLDFTLLLSKVKTFHKQRDSASPLADGSCHVIDYASLIAIKPSLFVLR